MPGKALVAGYGIIAVAVLGLLVAVVLAVRGAFRDLGGLWPDLGDAPRATLQHLADTGQTATGAVSSATTAAAAPANLLGGLTSPTSGSPTAQAPPPPQPGQRVLQLRASNVRTWESTFDRHVEVRFDVTDDQGHPFGGAHIVGVPNDPGARAALGSRLTQVADPWGGRIVTWRVRRVWNRAITWWAEYPGFAASPSVKVPF